MPNNNNIASGTFTGTTAAMNVEVGFTPSRVEIVNANSGATGVWFASMPDAYALIADTDNALTTSACITPWDGDTPYTTITGTYSITTATAAVTGSGTKFLTQLRVGDEILSNGIVYSVAAIASDTALTLDRNVGTTVSGGAVVRVTGRGPGFTLGTNATLNSAHVLYWAAFR